MGVIAVQLSTSGLIPNTTGLGNNLSQQLPVPIFIETNDTLSTVLATGYLNKSRTDFQFAYTNQQMALVYTTDQGVVWLSVVVSGTNYSLQGTTNVSTIYEAAVGSAAAPSYTFVGRTTDGLYSPSSHVLGVALNGIETASFTATGFNSLAGNIVAGASGTAGTLTSFPGTAANGKVVLAAVNNSGNHTLTISNISTLAQDTVMTVADAGAATGQVLVKTAAFVDGNLIKASGTAGLTLDAGIVTANVVVNTAAGAITLPNAVNTTSYGLVVVNITVGQAALATGGSVTLLASSASKQYQIIDMYLNGNGTNFSGGGGDRLGQVTDGTTVYSVVPAANMQALTNSHWGVTALPMPASAAVSTKTAAGAALTFKYSGGTTDYTAGSLVVTVIAIQTA